MDMEIAADDSVLQMVTISSRKLLENFIESPSTSAILPLVTIPALYRALTFENDHHGQCSTTLIAICRWIADEANRDLNGARTPFRWRCNETMGGVASHGARELLRQEPVVVKGNRGWRYVQWCQNTV